MSSLQEITCPDCGPVHPAPDTWDRGVPISGICPKCRERVYYAPNDRPLTPEEAQAAYDAAVPVPLSKERIQEIVDYAVGRAPAQPREVLWEAINEYAAACGGDTSNATVSVRRMNAVAAVERVIAAKSNPVQEPAAIRHRP